MARLARADDIGYLSLPLFYVRNSLKIEIDEPMALTIEGAFIIFLLCWAVLEYMGVEDGDRATILIVLAILLMASVMVS